MRTNKVRDKQVEQRILERTIDLISQRGLRGWNMDKVAVDAGVSRNTLYKIISTKEKLIEKIVIDYIRNVQIAVAEIIEQDQDFLETIEKVINKFSSLMDSLYGNSLGEIFMEYPSIERKAREHRDKLSEILIDFFKRGIDKGIIRDDVTPDLIYSLFNSLLEYNFKTRLKGSELSDQIKLSFMCLLNGILQ